MFKKLLILLLSISFLNISAEAQQNIQSPDINKNDQEKKVILDIQGIIRTIIDRNIDVQKAMIDFSDSDTDHKKFNGQYDIYAYSKLFSQYRQLSPNNPAIEKEGYQVGQTGAEAGLQKSFKTGTTVQTGISTLHQKLNMPVTGEMVSLKGYSSALNIQLSQELLKNAFGSNDRLTEKSLLKTSEIKQRAAKQAVSETIMNCFVAYWNYIIADENLKTAATAFKNTREIRDLVRRKTIAGISEKEELYDWESRVLQSKNGQDGSEVGLVNARLAILRTLQLDRKTNLEIVQNLTTDAPSQTIESAVSEAIKNRMDLQNMKSMIDVSEMNLNIAKDNALPSLKASGGYGYNDYDKNKVKNSFDTLNRQWNVSVSMSTPIFGTYDDANIESAKKTHLKNKLLLKQLEDGIRDEIMVKVTQCEASYKIYKQTSQSSEYAKSYYEQVYKRFSQGRYESAQLKLAFDNYILLKNSALKSLMDYNVCLLELDIAKNTVFEKYSVNIDKICGAIIK